MNKFKVGDRVYSKSGTLMQGTIFKTYDNIPAVEVLWDDWSVVPLGYRNVDLYKVLVPSESNYEID